MAACRFRGRPRACPSDRGNSISRPNSYCDSRCYYLYQNTALPYQVQGGRTWYDGSTFSHHSLVVVLLRNGRRVGLGFLAVDVASGSTSGGGGCWRGETKNTLYFLGLVQDNHTGRLGFCYSFDLGSLSQRVVLGSVRFGTWPCFHPAEIAA